MASGFDPSFFARVITAATALCCSIAYAEGVSGEIQLMGVVSKDTAAQRSLYPVSVYVEKDVAADASVFFSGYRDQEYWSATVGLARKLGDLQVGIGLGQATYNNLNHLVINPWAYYSSESYTGLFHIEFHGSTEGSSHYYKSYLVKQFGALSVGGHAEKDFGIGPRVEAALVGKTKVWATVPILNKPPIGAMKAMLGLTAEF